MAEKEKAGKTPSVNPAKGVRTPALPTKTTRNDGYTITNKLPVTKQGGKR